VTFDKINIGKLLLRKMIDQRDIQENNEYFPIRVNNRDKEKHEN